ncbi:sigma-70 family RNA polymerase sigma factor [Methylobacillus gramineus]|uniref:sigma-70 family RNA polymerase sigma factor n=1 Tax=Methylobacillus gramineus TaxID=755169 RepID=UPI001CFF8B68|nr:sigma-70 family RNA polymerase sigma factor [Methylobacillus gramineus]MCB5184254.1 sigma-70 family RNA polymerase sigma factor [Methylobacillus gramineus]
MKTQQSLSLQLVGELYDQHHRWLVKWLHGRVGCPQNAADLAQDTFTRVLAARETLYVQEAKALLTMIAKGLMVDHFRKSALEKVLLEALAAMPESQIPSPEARMLALEALVAVDTMLDGLPSSVRQAFLLSQLDGLTYAEIAERLKVSLSSVQQYMTRAYTACYAVIYADQ